MRIGLVGVVILGLVRAGTTLACTADADCADATLCTIDTCVGDVCVHTPVPNPPAENVADACNDTTDQDCDGLIDCQDPDCQVLAPCRAIGRDPSIIRFGPTGAGLDFFKSHGRVDAGVLDLSSEAVTWLLTNGQGLIWGGTLLPGDLVAGGGRIRFRYKDLGAREGLSIRDGIYTANLIVNSRGTIYYKVRTYGDLTKATTADMAIQMYLGGQTFIYAGPWRQTANGWIGTPAELDP